MSFHIVATPKCEVCGEVGDAEDLGRYVIDMLISNPRFPSGWQTVNGKMVCPKHKIIIEGCK